MGKHVVCISRNYPSFLTLWSTFAPKTIIRSDHHQQLKCPKRTWDQFIENTRVKSDTTFIISVISIIENILNMVISEIRDGYLKKAFYGNFFDSSDHSICFPSTFRWMKIMFDVNRHAGYLQHIFSAATHFFLLYHQLKSSFVAPNDGHDDDLLTAKDPTSENQSTSRFHYDGNEEFVKAIIKLRGDSSYTGYHGTAIIFQFQSSDKRRPKDLQKTTTNWPH